MEPDGKQVKNRGNEAVAPHVRTWRVAARAMFFLSLAVAAACAPKPTGEEIVGRMLDALGPESARTNVRSLRTVAEGTGPNGLFVTAVTSIRPDAVYFHQETGLGTTEIWSTPERTWGGSNGEAYAEFSASVRDFVRNHEFHLLLLDIRRRFSGFTYEGTETVDGNECLRVSMSGESGNAASICVRAEDWLPAELTLDPADADALRIELGDWRVVDGISLFHSICLHESAGDVFTYDYVEISAASFGQEMDIPKPTLPEQGR